MLLTFVIDYCKSHGIAVIININDVEYVLDMADSLLFVMRRQVLRFNSKDELMISSQQNVTQYLSDNYIS